MRHRLDIIASSIYDKDCAEIGLGKPYADHSNFFLTKIAAPLLDALIPKPTFTIDNVAKELEGILLPNSYALEPLGKPNRERHFRRSQYKDAILTLAKLCDKENDCSFSNIVSDIIQTAELPRYASPVRSVRSIELTCDIIAANTNGYRR